MPSACEWAPLGRIQVILASDEGQGNGHKSGQSLARTSDFLSPDFFAGLQTFCPDFGTFESGLFDGLFGLFAGLRTFYGLQDLSSDFLQSVTDLNPFPAPRRQTYKTQGKKINIFFYMFSTSGAGKGSIRMGLSVTDLLTFCTMQFYRKKHNFLSLLGRDGLRKQFEHARRTGPE